MRVADLMTANPRTLDSTASLADAADLMRLHGIRHLPIVDQVDGKDVVAGILSDRDLRMALGPEAASMNTGDMDPRHTSAPVDWFMAEDPLWVSPDAPVTHAIDLLVQTKYGAPPVMKGDELVGILSVVDVLKAARQHLP